ncbi:hypothetical protein ACD661_00810 [Legionella lytica]|uniref:Substrate of the Dot/Icm secretion system n=1 Tax=Legionella lytica TaxID=96232 RepID=A0ABW8D561_9GAMM
MNTPNSSPSLTPILHPSGPVPPLNLAPIPDPFDFFPPPLAPQKKPNNSQEVLELLFSDHNINARFEERCNSLYYFNTKAFKFGELSIEEEVDKQIDNPSFPDFKRLSFADLPSVRAEGRRSDFRFAVINQNDTVNILFSKWSGKVVKGDGMSHSQLACGKEEASACIAAGEIEFIDEGGQWKIKRLSNQTGHFQCPVETLLAPLILLIKQEDFPFASQFNIVLEYGHDFREVEINFADLRKIYDKKILARETSNTKEHPDTLVQLDAPVINEVPVIKEKEVEEVPLLTTTHGFFGSNARRKIDHQQDKEYQEEAGNRFNPRSQH